MLRLLFRNIATAMGIILLLSSCSNETPIRIAMHDWIGYQTLPIAQQMGLIDNDTMQIISSSSGSSSMQLIREGKVDAAALTLDESIQLISEGVKLSVIFPFDISSGADVVLSRYPIDKLANMKAISIGFDKSGLGSLMFSKMLAITGLNKSQFDISNIPADQHKAYWQTKVPDMLITYEPTASELIQSGAIRLLDTRQMPNTVFDVLVVKQDAIRHLSKALTSIIKAQYQLVGQFQSNKEAFYYRIAHQTQLSSSTVADILRGLILPNKEYSIALMKGQSSKLQQTAASLSQLMYEEGIIKQPVDANKIVHSALLLKALSSHAL